jgi:hypothetical protein
MSSSSINESCYLFFKDRTGALAPTGAAWANPTLR